MPSKNDLIKTVRARTAKEALALARARYGEDALVLYTNTRWKLLEKFGFSWVEVGVLNAGVSRALLQHEAQTILRQRTGG
jgi:flagellar biosynthesis GTPase FlhF